MADAKKRGRMLKKLTLDQGLEIEQRIKSGKESLLRIAKDFGVSQPTISRRKILMIREGRLEPTIVKVMREGDEKTAVKIFNKPEPFKFD